MTSVNVSLEDLETLVMTTGALKTIESALTTRKNDPFIREHLDFTDAHNRLATAMRNARRAEAGTLIPWDGELEGHEEALLRAVAEGGFWITREEKVPSPDQTMSTADKLAAKGCIVIGQFVVGVLFAGLQPELQVDPKGFPLRITDRGREKLVKLDAPKEPEIRT